MPRVRLPRPLAEVPMTAALPLLAVFLATPLDPPPADRDTERRVTELARQVADQGLDFFARVDAVEALAKLGPAAKAAVPALLRALHDPSCATYAASAL